MFAMRKDTVRNDTPEVRLRKIDEFCLPRGFFVKNGPELRFFDNFLEDCELRTIKVIAAF